ncbi:hypothetical protein UA08_03389 [Talaromyces atroroseus]|uniref:Uncharacterized protein n=1 Tax=Talaromyces atroroseus TaxID=1441469 RepID=A0A225AII2_TALAT|nr:hypothetical protein UA08_03389 [Talaromyces atroroseus]OKL61251.1 hypothetical protein UA08_03389 [Talaromyces atroroseus]
MGLAAKYYLALLFPLFSVFASFAIFTFSKENGVLDLLEGFGKQKTLPSASGSEALKTSYTGIEAIDEILTVLTLFFAPVVDGSNASLALHSFAFSGAFGSAWILAVLESWRAGSSRKFVSFPSIFGIVAQVMTYAVSAPLFLGLQLLFSDVSLQPTARNIAIPTAVVKAIPAVFIVAYILPTYSMLLPAPGIVTFEQKQTLIALWQLWPAYVSFLLTLVSILFSSTSSATPSQLRKSLRATYTFALSYAAISHVAAWSISLATIATPMIFSTEYLHSLHPSQVFGLRNPFTSADFKVDSASEGVHIFLQWDNIIGSLAVLLWAVIANVSAHRKTEGQVGWLCLLFQISTSLALTGPIGTAVRLVWERDELVFEEEDLKNAARKGV